MSEHENQPENESENPSEEPAQAPMGVPDEALPQDLVAGEDNPLAEGLEPGQTVEGLLEPGDEDPNEDPGR